MNNEELISDREYQMDETLFDAQQGNAPLPIDEEEAVVQSAKPAPTWVKVSGGTVAGLLLGASSTFLTSSASTPNKEETEAGDDALRETNTDRESMFGNEPVPIATGVNDDMTFSEAFATARHEVGAGGAFEWHGNIYGTYYAEEWNNMSAEQQADYHSHVVWQPKQHADNGDVPNDTSNEVEVLGVVHDFNSGANIVGVTMNEQDVYLVDVDNNNSIDMLVADVNKDGQIARDEVADISANGLTVDQFIHSVNPMDGNSLSAGDEGQTSDCGPDAMMGEII